MQRNSLPYSSAHLPGRNRQNECKHWLVLQWGGRHLIGPDTGRRPCPWRSGHSKPGYSPPSPSLPRSLLWACEQEQTHRKQIRHGGMGSHGGVQGQGQTSTREHAGHPFKGSRRKYDQPWPKDPTCMQWKREREKKKKKCSSVIKKSVTEKLCAKLSREHPNPRTF